MTFEFTSPSQGDAGADEDGCAAHAPRRSGAPSALQQLDSAMANGPRHFNLDASRHDAVFPPAPFAMLLCEAFAPQLKDEAFAQDTPSDPAAESFACRWEREVLEPFADRYRLWYWSWLGDR